jgi:hypothetical protein
MDFADQRPPPKTTAQAFDLDFDPAGDNVFVLSSLFPQAFGRKRKAPPKEAPEEPVDDDGTESEEDTQKEIELQEKDQPRQRYDVVARLERLFGGGELATGLNHDSDSDGGEYYGSDDSFIDDSEAFEAAERRDVEQRTKPQEHNGFFAVSGELATVEAPAPPEKPRKKKVRRLVSGEGPTAAHVNALLDKDASLTCQQQNPKRGESALRYDRYKAATSAKQLLALGASRADFKNDLAKGYMTLKEPLAGLVINLLQPERSSKRCGACEGCTADECGACKYCLDMAKRGGQNTLRRPCVKRACVKPMDGGAPATPSSPQVPLPEWTRYVDQASGKPYWHDGVVTTWDDPTGTAPTAKPPTQKKRPLDDAEGAPVKMRKQSGYVYFQSRNREAAKAAVDVDPDTNSLGAKEKNQNVMKKLAEMWGALDAAAKQKWSDDAPKVPVKERKKKKEVAAATPAAAKQKSPKKAFGSSIPLAVAAPAPAPAPRKPSSRAKRATPAAAAEPAVVVPPPGSRVSVRFSDGEDYAGTVENALDERSAMVFYDDGEREDVDFTDPDVRVTRVGPEAVPPDAAAAAEADAAAAEPDALPAAEPDALPAAEPDALPAAPAPAAKPAKKPAAKKPAARAKKATPAPRAKNAAPVPAPAPTAAPASPAAAPAADEEARFKVGDTVDVAARTFPGINKAGGTGSVTKVNDERLKDGGAMRDGSKTRTTGFTYAVKYTISGSEKRVDAQWISLVGVPDQAARRSSGAADDAPEATETLRTAGGRIATVIERRARGWIYVELDGNANDEGGAHEKKSFRNSQLVSS